VRDGYHGSFTQPWRSHEILLFYDALNKKSAS